MNRPEVYLFPFLIIIYSVQYNPHDYMDKKQGLIQSRILQIREKITRAALANGRRAEDIDLMAVSKHHGRDEVLEALSGGQQLLGENRVQEAVEKYSEIEPNYTLHLIGHLQTNKAKHAVKIFDCIQSIDKVETASAVNNRCNSLNKEMDILLEVNTSGEPTKFGVSGEESLFSLIDGILDLDRLHIKGLMTIAPFTDDMVRVGSAFRELRRLYDIVPVRYRELNFDVLSMGMSADYEIAIQEGSTMLRVGTGIFGPRIYPG
jgi:PLP dependent protein